MVTKLDLINNLNEILNPIIGYCPTNKKYLINGFWDTDISIYGLDEITYNFEKYLLDNISNFNNPKEIIKEIYEIIWDKIDWYSENEIFELSFFNAIKNKIINIDDSIVDVPIIEEDYFTIDYVRKINYDKELVDDNGLFLLLHKYKDITNNFSDEIDLEKVKLINALQIHFDSINILYDSLYKIEIHFEEINLEAVSAFQSFGNIKPNPLKCNINLDKIETAVFFRYLMDSKMIFMDSVVHKNKVKLQNFFENNFNFTSKDGYSYPISRLNNELGKISVDNELDKQLSTLENLIISLTRYKSNIESKYKKKSP
jgi:hypothetical protein